MLFGCGIVLLGYNLIGSKKTKKHVYTNFEFTIYIYIYSLFTYIILDLYLSVIYENLQDIIIML